MTEITDNSPIMAGGEAEKAADIANYFCSYAYLYHQKQMLMDHVRMKAYHGAIMQNKHLFKDKVILDVGTGSGILSIWAAQAGAAKVYAIEYTDMAKHAKALVEANGLSHIVEVMQTSVEDLQLDCKVDIIISEWMGYILLRESMLDSVIRARDRWMKPGGSMFPSHATIYFAPISYEEDRDVKYNEYTSSITEWSKFAKEMKTFYNVNINCLTNDYHTEQENYFIYSSLWTELKPEHVVGEKVVIKQLDLNKCTLEDSEGVDTIPYSFNMPFPVTVSGFAGWFTVDFNGSEENPCTNRVLLSTGPEMGYTHWGQQVFYLKDAIPCATGTKLSGEVSMTRQNANKRLYNLNLKLNVDDEESSAQTLTYEIP